MPCSSRGQTIPLPWENDEDVPDELSEPEDTDSGPTSDGASEPEQETQA